MIIMEPSGESNLTKNNMLSMSSSTLVFLASLIWMPICFSINYINTFFKNSINQWSLWAIIVGCFLLLLLMIHVMKDKSETTSQPLFYFFAACSFIYVTNLLIGLENDDFIAGFVQFYTKRGELYLKSAHGTLTCYWDGVIHYGMCLTMLAAISWGQSYRDVAFVWVGSMLNSLLVSLCGLIFGKCQVHLLLCIESCILLVVIFAICKFLSKDASTTDSNRQKHVKYSSILKRPLDLLIILLSLIAIVIHIFRGAIALPSDHSFETLIFYVRNVEPYLNDPVTFPKLQMLINLFYVVPFLCCGIYCLIMPGRYNFLNWSLLLSGAVIQGQFVHMFASIHMRTPYIYRLQSHNHYVWLFWLVNALAILPHILLVYRSQESPEYFCLTEKNVSQTQPMERKPRISAFQNPYLRSNSLEKKAS